MNQELYEKMFIRSTSAKLVLELIYDSNHIPEDYSIVACNAAFLRMFGFEDAKLVIRQSLALQKNWNHQRVAAFIDQIRDRKNTITIYSDLYAVLLEVQIEHLDENYYSVRFIDTTKSFLKDTEIDRFLNINLDMLCVMDLQGTYLNINQEFETVLGYQKHEIIGKTCLDFVHSDDAVAMAAMLMEIQKKQAVTNFVSRFLSKDGTYRYLEWNLKPTHTIVYSSARDITQMKLTQEKLIKANEQLSNFANETKRINLHLEHLSTIDQLTGIFNRRYINRKVNEESRRMHRYRFPLSVIFFDVDHFKQINDTYGHIVGDDILKVIASIVNKNIRATDIFGRWGGEEFIVITPHTTEEEAFILAEKLRELIASHKHPIVEHVTCSFGVVERNTNETLKEFYERADDAMYKAKTEGRNKVFKATMKEPSGIGSVYLEWNDALLSGNSMIDKQHKRILLLANELIDMILASDEAFKIEQKMQALQRQIIQHFKLEALFMRKIGYPNLEAHKTEHRRLIEKGNQFLADHTTEKLSPTAFFAYVVDDIVFGHLMTEDQKYITYMKEKGLNE